MSTSFLPALLALSTSMLTIRTISIVLETTRVSQAQ